MAQAQAWRHQLKACERAAGQIVYRDGPHKEARVKQAGHNYMAEGRAPSEKGQAGMVAHLASPEAACVTGASLIIGGGFAA